MPLLACACRALDALRRHTPPTQDGQRQRARFQHGRKGRKKLAVSHAAQHCGSAALPRRPLSRPRTHAPAKGRGACGNAKGRLPYLNLPTSGSVVHPESIFRRSQSPETAPSSLAVSHLFAAVFSPSSSCRLPLSSSAAIEPRSRTSPCPRASRWELLQPS